MPHVGPELPRFSAADPEHLTEGSFDPLDIERKSARTHGACEAAPVTLSISWSSSSVICGAHASA